MAISKSLRIYGYKVESDSSGEEALEKARRLSFDLLIIDVRMPGIDGIETIKRFRELYRRYNRPSIPEIIITGYIDIEAQREAERLGIKDYIHKPFAIDEFLKTIEERTRRVLK
jgi:CheY-like chemotaxis protein